MIFLALLKRGGRILKGKPGGRIGNEDSQFAFLLIQIWVIVRKMFNRV
jgi:hypothetical protein